jgi:preprotein translocase subunit SecE
MNMDTFYIKLIVWAVVIGVTFGVLWRKGQIARLADYIRETREELKKCTWPTREELKGSTVVVMVTLAILAAFTVGVDFVTSQLLSVILRIAG